MKGKFLVIAAILIAVVVVVLVNAQFSAYEEKANPPTVKVYKAAAYVAPGGKVKAAVEDSHLLQPVSLPEATANANTDWVRVDAEWAKDKVITHALRAGEFLKMSDIEALSSAEVQASIPEGKELFTIKVDQQTSVGYLVSPGDRVNVYVVTTRNDPMQPGGVAVEAPLVVGDVAVFAVDDAILLKDGTVGKRRGTAYSSLTLALTPEEREKVMAAQVRGKLTLTLKAKRPGQ